MGIFESLSRLCYDGWNMEINVTVEKRFPGCPKVIWLKNVIKQALKAESIDTKAEIGLLITGQEEIQQLNRDYLDEDRPTDVLSFPMFAGAPDTAFATPPDGKKHLGEIVISYPQALIQAKEHQHPVQREMAILLIHGVLHLLGYDHVKAKEKRQMQARETEILESLEEALK